MRTSTIFLAAMVCLLAIGCTAPKAYYDFYASDSYDGVPFTRLVGIIDEGIDEHSDDLRARVNIEAIRPRYPWRKSREGNVFVNNGWSISIERAHITGRYYINCAPAGGSSEAILIPTEYIAIEIKRDGKNLELTKFDRVVAMTF